MIKLNAKQLRAQRPKENQLTKIKRNPIYLLLDEIIDTYNIGSFFRLADATGIKKVYLCGNMEYPPNSRIHKAAVGTENWVPWERGKSTLEIIKKLKKQGVQIIAVEQHSNSTSYHLLANKVNFPCAVIAGNESFGIDKSILEQSDLIVELPMFGVNKSFNSWGTTAVVIYKILEKIK